jgi:hypothetical protein
MSDSAPTTTGLSFSERKQALAVKREEKRKQAIHHGFQVKRKNTDGETLRVFPSRDGSTPATETLRRVSMLRNEITGKEIPVIRSEETARMEAANRMISLVIRRIEFPKKGFQFVFSPTDRDDARAAGMLACVEFGFFDHGKAGIDLLRKIRSAIQGPDCLRLRRTWEKSTATPEKVAEEQGFSISYDMKSRICLKRAQIERLRRIMAILRCARDSDKSRKATANFKSNREFLLITLSLITEKLPRSMSANNFSKRKTIFLDYLAKGETLLSQSKPIGKSLVDEIRMAMETAFLA